MEKTPFHCFYMVYQSRPGLTSVEGQSSHHLHSAVDCKPGQECHKTD